MVSTTDTLKQAIADQLDALSASFDGTVKPSGVRISVWLLPDGRLREIETTPVFKVSGEKR